MHRLRVRVLFTLYAHVTAASPTQPTRARTAPAQRQARAASDTPEWRTTPPRLGANAGQTQRSPSGQLRSGAQRDRARGQLALRRVRRGRRGLFGLLGARQQARFDDLEFIFLTWRGLVEHQSRSIEIETGHLVLGHHTHHTPDYCGKHAGQLHSTAPSGSRYCTRSVAPSGLISNSPPFSAPRQSSAT